MTAIPLIIEADDDDPDCATVMVDGTIADRSYRFVVDTGAIRTHLVDDIFTKSLPRCGQHVSSGVFGPDSNSVATLPNLVVGSMVRDSIEAVIVDARQVGARNLLGMDVLQAHQCRFDFDSEQLVVDGEQTHGVMLPLQMDVGSHPYVEVRWRDVIAHAIWDSGAGITVVSQDFWLQHSEMFSAAATTLGTDATGRQVEVPTHMMAEVEIGGEVFVQHKVAVVDLSAANDDLDQPMDLLLGFTTLRQARWYFDFPRKAWSVTRYETS
ncbi:MAG: retropepsin-like aspartic protease [Aeromicrobium sp.]